jgi:hypothetical protein
MQGNSSNGEAGVMIRETLNTAATNATTAMWPWINTLYFDFRNTPGGSQTHVGSASATLPYWVKVGAQRKHLYWIRITGWSDLDPTR